MSSPSLFVLGVGCILNNWLSGWLCEQLGVARHLWVAGVAPSFVVYNMCDKTRLQSSARALLSFHLNSRTLVQVLAVGFAALVSVYFNLAPLLVIAMASCLYFLCTAFSLEKTLYMGDWCGAIAKQAFRKVVTNLVCETAWMKMKGEWNFCSPYSRKLETESCDHYYTLKKPCGRGHALSYPELDDFTFIFPLKECEVSCKFEYLKRRNGTERKEGPNKIELSLLYKKTPLEEYTYFNVSLFRVAQIRCLMGILEREGNLMFCNFHRFVGSGVKLAHAKCYEFEEMLQLVLSEGWVLKKVCLGAEYECSISGSSFDRDTAAGLLLGLACFLVCGFCELSPRVSAGVFGVGMLVFAPVEGDVAGLLAQCKRAGEVLLSGVLSSNLLAVFRAGLSALSGLWY